MTTKEIKQKEEEFLKENNAIEGVYDDDSLKQAEYAWGYLMSEDILTLGVVLKTHKILMLNQNLMKNEKGYFRNVMVYIGGKSAINAAHISGRVHQWCFKGMRAYPPIDTKKLHIEYEKIQPFVDGNGRTGRMFMNWQRIKRLKKPLLIIHTGKEQQEYYKWFKEV